jgi:O-antigen ligase
MRAWPPVLPALPPLLVLGLAAAVVAGLAAGASPKLVVAGLAGLVLVAIMLANVTAGVMIFALAAFAESLTTVAGGPSFAKLVGLFLVAGWFGAIGYDRPGNQGSLDFLASNAFLATVVALFVSWVFVSSLWAEDAGVARETFTRFALNFLLFPIIFVAIRRRSHVVCLYAILIGGALFVAAVGLATSGAGGDGRLAGAGVNPNQLGSLLAVGVVLAGALACYRPLSGAARSIAAVAAGLSAILLTMTQSRGSLLGLAVSALALPFLAGRGRRLGAALLTLIAAVAMSGWLLLVAPPETLQRLTHASVGSSTEGSGRLDLWRIGMRMFHDRPWTGIGAGNFQVSSVHYLLEPGQIVYAAFIVDAPKVPHNIYLQVLAELGIIGLGLFLTVVGICLISTLRAARKFWAAGDSDMDILARGLLIALVGILASYFFSSALFTKQLYLMLALGPALLAMAVREARRAAR